MCRRERGEWLTSLPDTRTLFSRPIRRRYFYRQSFAWRQSNNKTTTTVKSFFRSVSLEDLQINSLTRERRCCRSLNFGSDFRSQPPPEALSVQSLFWLENNCTFHLPERPLSKTAKLSPPSCNVICCPRSVVVGGGRCNAHSRFN